MDVNKIEKLLCDIGIVDPNSVYKFHDKVRLSEITGINEKSKDVSHYKDISVMKCRKSGVIFLSTTKHIDNSYYEDKDLVEYWESTDRKSALLTTIRDDERRADQFKHAITNKTWVDIGTGTGGILDLLSPYAKNTLAIEPQKGIQKLLQKEGYGVYSSVKDIPGKDIEVSTLFHTLEHIIDPLELLTDLKSKMKSGGKVIIEVPHANDFLLSFMDLDSFKSFTFWGEHLILHTRNSLSTLLERAGFSDISVQNYQRYPLANHLYWLKNNNPGGHIEWNSLSNTELDKAYSNMLASLNYTDTLIAYGTA